MNLKRQFDPIRDWANQRGIIEHGDPKTQTLKMFDEAGELARAVLADNKAEIKDGIGDIVVVLTSIAAQKGLRIEDCINYAYQQIKDRKGKLVGGNFVKNKS